MTLPKTLTTISEEFFQFDTMSAPPNFNENQIPLQEEFPEAQERQPAPLLEVPLGHQYFGQQNNHSQAQRTIPPVNDENNGASNSTLMASSVTSTSAATQGRLSSSIRENLIFQSNPAVHRDMAVEKIMPGIYLSKNFLYWNQETLNSFGFSHIIIIDKHIQELYYPSPIFQICAQSKTIISQDPYEDSTVYENFPSKKQALNFGKEFEAIDLNFGEKSYLTTVLPNCYRAVRFIKKAFQSGGTILVIDCNGGEQKCITIIVAFLMYKHNICFRTAFERLKDYYTKADLDVFYTRQLYEYEPILQVQKAQSRGHSCSRELHAAILKRKKSIDDESVDIDEENFLPFANNNTAAIFENNKIPFLTNSNFTANAQELQPEDLLHDSKYQLKDPFMQDDETRRWLEDFQCFHPLEKCHLSADASKNSQMNSHSNSSRDFRNYFKNERLENFPDNEMIISGEMNNFNYEKWLKFHKSKRMKDCFHAQDHFQRESTKERNRKLKNCLNDCEMY